MRRVSRYVVISMVVAILITFTTFLVGESAVAQIPGAHGAGQTALVSGFPIPYATFFRCCGFGPGYSISSNTYYYYPLNFVTDLTIWLAISLAVVFTLSLATLVLAAVAGLGITLLTLLLPPLSIVRPIQGLETVLRPMGFPYGYLTYYVTGLGGVTYSGYQFAVSPALADYALWTGIAAALIGTAVTMGRRRRSVSRLSASTADLVSDTVPIVSLMQSYISHSWESPLHYCKNLCPFLLL